MALGAAFAMGVLLLLPVLDWLLAPRPWLAPSVVFTASLGLVVVALPGVQGEDRHPELTSLILLIDDTLSALPSDSSSVASEARRSPGRWLFVRGSGDGWAQAWAVPGSTPGMEPTGLLLPDDVAWEVAGAGNAPELVPPSVEILSDSVADGLRYLGLLVRPGLAGEMLGLRIVDDFHGEVRSVDGQSVPSDASLPQVRRIRYWGETDPDGVRFDLIVEAESSDALVDVIEHHLRPTEVLGDDFFFRDRSKVPDAWTGTDRVVRRTRVRLPQTLALEPNVRRPD